jgi:hypothetical protein
MTWKRAQEFMRRHAVIPVAVLAILGVILVERLDFRSLVASTGTFNNAQAVVFIAPRDEVFMVDRVLWLDVRIHADVPINAVGATLAFDPAALEVQQRRLILRPLGRGNFYTRRKRRSAFQRWDTGQRWL